MGSGLQSIGIAAAVFLSACVLIGFASSYLRKMTRTLHTTEELLDIAVPSFKSGILSDPEMKTSGRSPLHELERKSRGNRNHAHKNGFGVGFEAKILSLLAFVVSFGGTGSVVVFAAPTSSGELLLRSSPFVLIALAIGAWAKASARGHRDYMQKKAQEQKGEFVLYFRSFAFDLTTLAKSHRVNSSGYVKAKIDVAIEEAIGAMCLSVRLGLRSIGRVEGQYGPAPVQTDTSKWQQLAVELMDSARLVIVVPAISEGSFWELEQIASSSTLSKTIWIMPPRNLAPKFKPSRDWHPVQKSCSDKLKLPFPQYVHEGAIFCYSGTSGSVPQISIEPFSFKLLFAILDASARDPENWWAPKKS